MAQVQSNQNRHWLVQGAGMCSSSISYAISLHTHVFVAAGEIPQRLLCSTACAFLILKEITSSCPKRL